MNHFTRKDIDEMEKIFRINLINSVSGIKPGNLIGTQTNEENLNLAIFSSVLHLGSNPPYLGFICRPNEKVKRDTYDNILSTGYYTINHIQESFVENAHFTSAKFEPHVSEFERCSLTPEFKEEFPAPFVMESKIKLGLKFVEEIPIKINGTKMIIGEIVHLFVDKEIVDDKGNIRLDLVSNIGIAGLNSYYKISKIKEYPYARPYELPTFS